MNDWKITRWLVLMGSILVLNGCIAAEAPAPCSESMGGALVKLPEQDPTVNYRFELVGEAPVHSNSPFSPLPGLDYWVWGGDPGRTDDGDKLMVRWDSQNVTFSPADAPPASCNLCTAVMCGSVSRGANPVLYQVFRRKGFASDAASDMVRALFDEGCPGLPPSPGAPATLTKGNSIFRTDGDATYELRFADHVSCSAEPKATNKVFTVENGSPRVVTYPASGVTADGKVRLDSPPDRFSPFLRISRIQLVVGDCQAYTDPATGKCQIPDGGLKKLYRVYAQVGTSSATHDIHGDGQLPDGNVDLINPVSGNPLTATPTFVHSSSGEQVTWLLAPDSSDPLTNEISSSTPVSWIPRIYAVQFTLVPNPGGQ